MAASTPKIDAFVRNYTRFIETSAAPSYEALKTWLQEIEKPDFWAARASSIYAEGKPTEGKERPDPAKHPIPSPVHFVKWRIKFADSALRKLREDKSTYGGFGPKSIAQLEDVIGGRVVVYFPHQLTWVDAAIRESPDVELCPGHHPKSFHDASTLERLGLEPDRFDARNRKTSGYSSLHYILRFREDRVPEGDSRPCFEVQVRTVAEELWGEIEHHIGYKPERRTAFSVQRQFRVISDHLQAVDMHLDFIYDEMQHFQSDQISEDDDLLNAENLPSVLSNLGIRITQAELGPVSDVLTTYKVKTVEDLHRRTPLHCLEAVRSAWRKVLPVGSEATALMTVNILASFDEPAASEAIELRARTFYALYQTVETRKDHLIH